MNPHDDDDGYRPDTGETKWDARWAERRTNEPDLDRGARPFYNLMMFPYPSAEGLHVGNVFAFTGADVYGRFQRLLGRTVFEPMGFDAFGIHSENFALKMGTHPAELIPRNIANFRRQLAQMGGMFDWRHELSTTDPAYYKWTQWVFLQLYHAGKAYRKKAAVNWCPRDKTVLANEQVINGFCERCGAAVEQRLLEQWFFRITEYAERLLANLDDASQMDWSASTATAQRNWIGRGGGAEVGFPGRPGPDRVLPPPARHALRRALPGARPGAPAGGRAHGGAVAPGDGRPPEGHRGARRGLPQGGREGEDRRLHRLDRSQSRHRPADPGVGLRLRADGLRHRRHRGRARSRRPRFRVREEVPAPDRPGARRSRRNGDDAAPGAGGGHRRLPPRQLRAVLGIARGRGHQGNRRLARAGGARPGRGPLPAARLVHLAAALLGAADPDHLLRRLRTGAGAGEGSPGAAAADLRFPARRLGHLSAGAAQGVVRGGLPGVRETGPPGDRRLRHLPRLGMVLPAVSLHRARRPAVRRRPGQALAPGGELHRGERARRPAPAVQSLHRDGAPRPGPAPVRGAVPEVPGPRHHREGRRQDVQDQGERGHPRPVHRPVGRRHLPHLPHVPRALRGGRRLPG